MVDLSDIDNGLNPNENINRNFNQSYNNPQPNRHAKILIDLQPLDDNISIHPIITRIHPINFMFW